VVLLLGRFQPYKFLFSATKYSGGWTRERRRDLCIMDAVWCLKSCSGEKLAVQGLRLLVGPYPSPSSSRIIHAELLFSKAQASSFSVVVDGAVRKIVINE
jgi:hypothetical protein